VIHLPSLTQLDRATKTRIWLCTGPTDMRRGFYRLAEQAEQVTRQHPQSGHLFICFINCTVEHLARAPLSDHAPISPAAGPDIRSDPVPLGVGGVHGLLPR
jgi:hypothetical protein